MKLLRTAAMASLLLCGVCVTHLAQAGQDTIRRALAQIVPEPYNVNIDSRISPDTVLQWDDTSDWMAALKQAAARGNLKVQPRWDAGRIDVVPGPAPVVVPMPAVQPVPAVQVAAVTPPPSPASAPVPAPAVLAPTPAPVVAVATPVKESAAVAATTVVESPSKATPVKVASAEPAKRPFVSLEAAPVAPAQEPKGEPEKAIPKGKTWAIQIKDLNLANTFQRWADAAGWRVRWDAAKHVMVEAPDSFTGSFEDAITAQLSSPGIAFSSYPLEVCFYPNTPPLARITRKGDQAKECQ